MKITPNILKGTVDIPSSKSEAHRAIICASFAKGKSIISNDTLSQDIIATINGLQKLGADIKIMESDKYSNSSTIEIGEFAKRKNVEITIDCNESGSTLRFLIPIAISIYDKVKFTGHGRLVERPLDVYFELFKKHNIKYFHGDNYLPLDIEGKLEADKFELDGNISSQFITGVMLANGIFESKTEISILGNLESKPYIDITQDVMSQYGVESKYNKKENKYHITGNGYRAKDFKVMGDWSHAGFLLLLGTKSEIRINGLDKASSQGDSVIVDILKSMGAKIHWDKDVLISEKSTLKGIKIDVSQCPDLAPVIGAAMAIAKGESLITGGERLKLKESDRIQAIVNTIINLGGDAKATDDGMIISGIDGLSGGDVSCYNDHRIAMMIGALSAYCTGDILVDGHNCVAKSYPHFWTDFEHLGGKI